MPHTLSIADKHRVVTNPMTATLRYRCGCTGGEVIAISVVFDVNADDERFIYTMRQALHDMRTEIRQHLKPQK